jgi:hypothetical protein
MPPQAVALAAFAGVVLAGSAVSLFCVWRASAMLRARRSPADTALELLEQKLDTLEQQVQSLRSAPPGPAPPPPRPGFNLEKRSHALRMHRRGESPAQIAAALDLPLQEIDLLLKVHRIVLRSF